MNPTTDQFNEKLVEILDEKKASDLLSISGVYEILSEEFNNEILERLENPDRPKLENTTYTLLYNDYEDVPTKIRRDLSLDDIKDITEPLHYTDFAVLKGGSVIKDFNDKPDVLAGISQNTESPEKPSVVICVERGVVSLVGASCNMNIRIIDLFAHKIIKSAGYDIENQ